MFIKCIEKIKRELQKYILKLIDQKKKKLKNDDDKLIHFSYKNSLTELNGIKNSDSEYESKRHQRRKENLLSIKRKEFEMNIETKY